MESRRGINTIVAYRNHFLTLNECQRKSR